MDLLSLLTVVALLIIAADMAGRKRSPLVMLAGLSLFGVAVAARLVTGEGFFATIIPLFTDIGVSLLLAAGWLAIRKSRAQPGPFAALGLMALGIAGVFYAGARFTGAATEADSFLLELGPDDRIDEVAAVLERFDARAERAFPDLTLRADEDLAQVYLVYGDAAKFEALMAALREDVENVDHVELNRMVSLVQPVEAEATGSETTRSYLENDPMVAAQWGLEAIHGHEAHALLKDLTPARKARVAIVDTGVDAGHEDVQAAFQRSPGTTDRNGHGTHCAGIAGAVTNNGLGVASLNWEGRFVEITGYPALGALGLGSVEQIAQAVLDAARDGADVISMSLGDVAPVPPKVLADAVDFAQQHGAIVVASAGNADRDAFTHFPSNIDGVLAVAAVDENLRKARFSNTNTRLARPLAAPGVNILSLTPKNGYEHKSGTSMATPMVAGLLGVMRAIHPNLTAEEAYTILHETGTVVEDTERVGRVINAEAALKAVREAM